MSVNCYDTQIALVENQGGYNSIQESVVRLYDVGRRKDDEDEQVNEQIYFLQGGRLWDKDFSSENEFKTFSVLVNVCERVSYQFAFCILHSALFRSFLKIIKT